MPVRTVRFPIESINQGTRHPGLEGDIIVLDQSHHPDPSVVRLRATAYSVAKAIGRSSTPYDTHQLELNPGTGLVSATVPLHSSIEGFNPLAEGPRVFSQKARRVVLERGLEWGEQLGVDDLLDLPQVGVAIASRHESLGTLVTGLRDSGHPLSDHAALVIDTAARAFRGQ